MSIRRTSGQADAAFRRGPLADLTLRAADISKQVALYNYRLFLQAAAAPSGVFERLSPLAALRAAEHAYCRVPAYRRLLDASGWKDNRSLSAAERISRLPETDKAQYVKRYSTEERCLNGKIPMMGTEIDESSGSSGTPFNWVRSRRELRELHRAMSQYGRMYFGNRVITINGFSMGAWATGVNVGEALRLNGIVKSTGPDVDKMLNTLEFFGPNYPYVITGYPPFLKHFLDQSEARGFDWSRYTAFGIVGGEGMSEGLRAYLERRFVAVYSCYGASDLDIGVAAETPISIWTRKQAASNPQLQQALFGDDPRLPMFFQYNPLDYYVESNERGELVITVNRLSLLSPRIRYNIHDAGGVLSFPTMLTVLREFGIDPLPHCRRPGQPIFRLPFLYLFGRSDSTLSYMGANIYPEDVEQALFADGEDARRMGAYSLELIDIGGGEQRACVHVELMDTDEHTEEFAEKLRRRVVDRLMATNRDFRSAVSEDAAAADVRLHVHRAGEGPFAANSGRLKRRYIVGAAAATAGASTPGA